MTSKNESEVLIENVGPIERLSIPVPSGGGVIVLRGPNGSGKTRALDAVDKLTAGEGRIDRREGVLHPGIVEGFGATIKIASRTSRAGDLEIVRLEDQTCIADLVDPKMKDPAASDRRRLKAILTMMRAEIDVTKFHEIIGGKDIFDSIVKPSSLDAGDAVEIAALVKRDFESASRDQEKSRDAALERAAALAASIEGIDLTVASDANQLRQAYDLADSQLRDLNARTQAANSTAKNITDARRAFDKSFSENEGELLPDALDEEKRLATIVSLGKIAISDRQVDLTVQIEKYDAAVRARKAAVKHDEQVAELKSIIDSAVEDGPSDDEIIKAEQKTEDAATAMERGGVIRKAAADKTEHDDYKLKAEQASRRADEYRDAAQTVDLILSQLVNDPRFTIIDGRITTIKADGRQVYYHDLSPGERWSIAMSVAVGAIGEGGVMVIPQDAWQDLDPVNRSIVADDAHQAGVVVITAEATDGALRAEEYSEDKREAS